MPGVRFLCHFGGDNLKRTTPLLVLAALWCLTAQEAYACTCVSGAAEAVPDPEAFAAEVRKGYEEHGGAVFTGRVVRVEEVNVPFGDPAALFPMKQVTVRVEKYWFGVQSPEAVIYTGVDGAACGVPYAKGRRYVFEANKVEGRLQTDICTYSKLSGSISRWYDKVFGTGKEFPRSDKLSPRRET
jgi:hypothetical protein